MEIEDLADSSGYIDEFIDITTESVNETLTPGDRKLEIVTQYSSGSFFLKEPRVITFGPVLTVPQPAP
ncbi:MAG: hypothetical protein LBP80_09870 [Treponema sp.]|nr:hypothetical protein [Treponema sp.]